MPQKKILLIIALMFACIAWFIFDYSGAWKN